MAEQPENSEHQTENMNPDTSSESGSEVSIKSMEESGAEAGAGEVAGKTMPEEQGATEGEVAGKAMPEEQGATGGAVAVSNIERLLQQQRSEIMFELRRLQMGERPVTGQGHKEAVENFFVRSLDTAPSVDPDEHRPETVVVEVSALAQRRPVSSLLQSSGFRRSLETALRTAIGTSSSSTPTPPHARLPRPSQAEPTQPQQAPPRSSQSGRPLPTWPTRSAGPRQSLLSQIQRRALPSRTPPQATSSAPPPPPQLVPAPPPLPPQELFNAPSTPTDSEPVLPAEDAETNPADMSYPRQWLAQNIPSVSEQRAVGAWEMMEQAQREDLIADISDLVQRQLVTDSLQGPFRNVLESRMQERVANSPANGERVQEFIRNLQQSTRVQRNDFSGIGLQQDAQEQLSDDVSVISATAAVTVQTTQQQALMSREMRALKAQVQELKNMMKMSMDMQLDTQRAIRQEVAAALAQASGSTVAPPEPASKPVDDAHCLICLDKVADSVLYQCGHLCVCHGCGLQLKQRGCHCPVCRAPIKDIIRAYKSGQNK